MKKKEGKCKLVFEVFVLLVGYCFKESDQKLIKKVYFSFFPLHFKLFFHVLLLIIHI